MYRKWEDTAYARTDLLPKSTAHKGIKLLLENFLHLEKKKLYLF